jgi:hypothetical protein
MVDFSTYQPPGVYVQDTSTPVVTPAGSAASLVTVVGPASGYETVTESVALHVAPGVGLQNRGVFTTAVSGPPAIAAPVVKTSAGLILTPGVDYSFTSDTSGGGGATNAVALLVRLPSGGPSTPTPNGANEGDIVSATYSFADPQYYTPQLFDEYDLLAGMYGRALATVAPADPNTSQVNSPLTYAAKIAFENGAGRVLALATNPADGDFRTQLQNAYAKLLANPSVSIVVPVLADGVVYGGSTSDAHSASAVENMVSDVRLHCDASAAAGYGRIAIVGVDRNYDAATEPFPALAGFADDKRVVLAYPNRLLANNPATNQTIEVGGMYLAAAYAGQLAYNPVARGLTRMVVRSFTGIPPVVQQSMTLTANNAMSQAGVAVTELNRLGQMVVRHGVTTDPSSLTSREISLVRIADTLFQLVQSGLDYVGLIGQPITVEMPTQVKGTVSTILENARLSQVIQAWGNLLVRQQHLPDGDPTVIEVKFAYAPAVPLNYVEVSFSIDLTTGDLSNTSLPAQSSTGTAP